MRHPGRDPGDVVCDEIHLPNHVERGEELRGMDWWCCWCDPDGSWWRVDIVDGVAVTWCNGVRQEIPF